MTEEEKERPSSIPKIEVGQDQENEPDKKSEVGSQLGDNLDIGDEIKDSEDGEGEDGEGGEDKQGEEGEPEMLTEDAEALKRELQKIIIAPPMNPK